MKYILYIWLCLLIMGCQNTPELIKLRGPIFGTSYNIQYYDQNSRDFTKNIDSLFKKINNSMSNYQENSTISKLNRNEIYSLDNYFITVFNTSKKIYRETEGVFDPTIGSLVNYWNFGSETNTKAIDSSSIDSLMRFVGFNKVTLHNNKVVKPNQGYLDFNAIAKGYGIDVIAEFLLAKDISNFLVEIGGEIRVSGNNLKKEAHWKIGIQNPDFNGESSYNKVISLQNQSMATSGVYRKFKTDSLGNRYAHIINTKTGYPAKTNILSVSVIANNCMLADGYATALQAMDLEHIKQFLARKKQIKAYVIFENNMKQVEVLSFNGFPIE